MVDELSVGKPLERTDALGKVLGKTVYGVDLRLPGMLYGKVLYSDYAHARIKNIDTSKAESLPGVKAVITGADCDYTYGSTVKDRPFLARGVVRYKGEAVAAVAAVDEEIAMEALRLIEVEYEELPVLLDPVEAMENKECLLHENLINYKYSYAATPVEGTNICSHYKLRKGDVEAGFKEADYIIEDTYKTQMVQHICLEPHMAVAHVEPVTGEITVWSGTVSPYMARKELADALKYPMAKIRIIVPDLGGSFGSKMYLKTEPYAVALSMKTGTPVKVVMTREEEFYMVVKGPTATTIKTGVKKDGTITARKIRTIWDTGAYADCGPRVCRNSGHTSAGPYRIANVQIDGYCVYTNKNIGGAFRGYGVQELSFAYESHTDDVAKAIKMDPLEFRLKNALRVGDEGATGQVIEASGLEECLHKAAEGIGWTAPLKATEEKAKYYGRGIAMIHKATGAPSTSSAFMKFNEDGTINLLVSTVEQGQGSNTVLAQIAAEEMGVDLDRIYMNNPDTAYTPFDSSTTSSRSTFCMGNAIILAVRDIKQQMRMIAAEHYKVAADQVEVGKGKLWVKGQEDSTLLFQDLITRFYGARGGTILGRGFFRPEAEPVDPETGLTRKMTPFWMYGVQAAEVEVDAETGRVKILKLVAAHDLGRAINPLNCYQQIEGSLVMGMSGALLEDVKLNEHGTVLNPNLHDYKISTTKDIPILESHLVEARQPDGPYGAKGVGEPALAATAPAIANAICNAIGGRIKDLPLTPEKVYRELRNINKDENK